MANNMTRAIDIFENKLCSVCGTEGISQYYTINENYIEYCGIFHSLHEVLCESLDIAINRDASLQICLDCKEKVIKFYHFKRKVKDAQKSQQKTQSISQTNSQISQKPNKIVQNIFQIIESYTEKCSVTAIRVEESNKKLIIEANDVHVASSPSIAIKHEPESEILDDTSEYHQDFDPFQHSEASLLSDDFSSTSNSESVILIKEEPDDVSEVIIQNIERRSPMPVARKKTSIPIRQLPSMTMTATHSQLNGSTVKKYQQIFGRRQRKSRMDAPVSAAAAKMRIYREKLKKPENRDKYIQHQQKQKEWNRQYYQRKMMKDMLPFSSDDVSHFMFNYPN